MKRIKTKEQLLSFAKPQSTKNQALRKTWCVSARTTSRDPHSQIVKWGIICLSIRKSPIQCVTASSQLQMWWRQPDLIWWDQASMRQRKAHTAS